MSVIDLALGRWMRRMGVTQPQEPEVLYSVQPVILVGDHTGVTPRVQGPSIILGGNSPTSGVEFSVMEYHSLSPGGMLISVHQTAVGSAVFGIVDDESIWGALGPVEMDRDMIGQPTPLTRGFMGTVVTNALSPIEIYPYQTGVPHVQIADRVYVPNGRIFLIEGITSFAISGWAHIEELPAPRTPQTSV